VGREGRRDLHDKLLGAGAPGNQLVGDPPGQIPGVGVGDGEDRRPDARG
jgi:hypothetical protein